MTYNMLCSPLLTNEQVSLCDAYLTGIPNDIEELNEVTFKHRICQNFNVTTDELAYALSNFRLFYNDITCIHCGIRYEITQPLVFHDLPKSPYNWTCESCHNFLKKSFDFSLLMDWYPPDVPNSNDDNG